MATQYFGERIKRNEDPRLLTGQALFVDDVHLPGMLHAAFLRSPYAHARIKSVDVTQVLDREGVVGVYTAADIGDYWCTGPLLVSPPPIEDIVFNARTQPNLAVDKARHVGEPIAVVVAESRYVAEDALADILVDFEPLPAVVDMEGALEPDSALVHDDLGSNLGAHVIQRKGDYEKAREQADVIIKRRFYYDHGTAAAMENRGYVAQWDNRAQRMTMWGTTQAPIPIRNGLASMLGLSENQVRVIAPFIGGGFGPKIMMFYPEETLVPWLAKELNRPIKWIEDRSENFVATTQERDQVHYAEIALTSDGKILGVHDVFYHDGGAYDPYGLTVPINSQCTLLGPYDIPNYYSEFKASFTNKPIVTPFRGAGRQHGVFVIERLLDLASKELGIDDFVTNEQPKLRAEGKNVGIGVVAYVEGTGIGPYEGARVQVQASGKVAVVTGVGTQGQGHFTSFAQIVADQLGVRVEDVEVVTGDTDQFHWGTGTFASRGAVVAGNAINEAAKDVRQKVLKLASDLLEAAEEDLEIRDGTVFVKGVPEGGIPLGQLAADANPLRGAVKPGTEPGLESTNYFGPETGATANGVHAMILEIDPETMLIELKKFVVVHDCGRVINPLILDGQVQGGVAQGIGNAFYEKLSFDRNGQLLNGSFMDYLIPTALDVPNIIVGHKETPSPLNPMGIKGAGEAGAIPAGPLFAQAIEDALDIDGFEILEIPLSPNRLWELVNEIK
jgi:CO/xanthine dehydrogenase Mo-binding subunit